MWSLWYASALPSREVNAAEIAAWTGGDEAFIREKVGIDSRRFLGAGENPLDLAKAAALNALGKANLTASDLDFLIFVTQSPDFRLPQSSALLADAMGARQNIAAFDISLGCSGWVYALTIAKSLSTVEGLKTGIIVTCDPYSRGISRNDKSTVTVFGDAASATVMKQGGPVTIGNADFGTDGGGGMGLAAKKGGARHPIVSIDTDSATESISSDDYRIQMDGRAILDFMQTRVPSSVERCLERNGLVRNDISKYVFHQASKYMLNLLTRRMDLDPNQVPIEIRDVGNTVSSSIPIVLERLSARGELEGKIVVAGFGVGLSWCSNVLSYNN